MVAPRKTRKTPQMFMGAPAAPQATQPAGMFAAPLTRPQPKRDFDWASLLQGVGAGLLTGNNVGEGLGQGLILARQFADQRADNERYDRRDQREEERYQYGLNKDQAATAQAAAEKAARDAAIDQLPISPELKAAMKASDTMPSYGDLVPKADKGPAGVQEYEYAKQQGFQGTFLDYEKAKAEAGRAPVQGDGTWERYVDPQTGRAGQRNTRTGKIDWDPGNTMLAQVGTDAQGNPVYDFVGAPGPTKEFEVKAANQSLLLGQGIDELERLVNEGKVSPYAVAGSEQAGQVAGPLGDVAGQSLLSPEDKQYLAARASALESLANTITGAAFTEQQKLNFQNMLPKPTDDKVTAQGKIQRMRAYLKELETNAKVGDRRQKDDTVTTAPKPGDKQDGYQFLGGDPADPKNWVPVQ